MLYQLHWQFKNGHTEMRAQGELGNFAEVRDFINEVKRGHPLPKGAIWLMCNEKSHYFVMAVANTNGKTGYFDN